jgi:hypothetical protein
VESVGDIQHGGGWVGGRDGLTKCLCRLYRRGLEVRTFRCRCQLPVHVVCQMVDSFIFLFVFSIKQEGQGTETHARCELRLAAVSTPFPPTTCNAVCSHGPSHAPSSALFSHPLAPAIEQDVSASQFNVPPPRHVAATAPVPAPVPAPAHPMLPTSASKRCWEYTGSIVPSMQHCKPPACTVVMEEVGGRLWESDCVIYRSRPCVR